MAMNHEACVWPVLHDQIADLIQKYPYRQQSDEHNGKDAKLKLVQPVDPTDFYSLCAAKAWRVASMAGN